MTVNGGVLDLNGYNSTVGTLAGAGGTVLSNLAGNTTLTVNMPSGTSAYSGALANGQGTLALVVSGNGTLTLAGPNTYTGATTLYGGTLNMAAGGSITSGTASQMIVSNRTGNAVLALNGGTVMPTTATARRCSSGMRPRARWSSTPAC